MKDKKPILGHIIVLSFLFIFHEQQRGATIYAEFLGGSFTCDAYHMTEPHPKGNFSHIYILDFILWGGLVVWAWTSMLEVSSSKPIVYKSKGFALVELVAPGLPDLRAIA